MTAVGVIGLVLSIVGLALNAHHRKLAQKIFVVGNIMWLAYGIDKQLAEVMAAQSIYLVLNVRTVRAWGREANAKVIIAEAQ